MKSFIGWHVTSLIAASSVLCGLGFSTAPIPDMVTVDSVVVGCVNLGIEEDGLTVTGFWSFDATTGQHKWNSATEFDIVFRVVENKIYDTETGMWIITKDSQVEAIDPNPSITNSSGNDQGYWICDDIPTAGEIHYSDVGYFGDVQILKDGVEIHYSPWIFTKPGVTEGEVFELQEQQSFWR